MQSSLFISRINGSLIINNLSNTVPCRLILIIAGEQYFSYIHGGNNIQV